MVELVSSRLILVSAAILCSLSSRSECRSKSRFINVQCESYNESYAAFEKCKLNLLGRGRVGADVYLKLFQTPIDNCWINWSMYRRYNGFRPFLYNISTDLCQLLGNPNALSFQGLVMNAIKTGSNLNHSCPYNHDIIMDNMEFSDDFLKTLPLPQGIYKIQLRFATYKVWRVQVTVFIERKE
ncbi:uncharacterized protein LOC117138309 isoform X1 [Drosophila mauritiana]|uniref:Uncharacterized protein LOC117138309 isoform X1 n=1 Tax=Drosophila mauritiana TaxID=7226 RepID=A0A6P8JUG5_DROMA|nr:uncharacterized protein LOC117138309 isoform X1 [Drosophila mauritiana]XP_033156205.1 uncharacterized protein LOC117138309 isoform X1 [Drosophila mauritiana]XP_033156206.1 uncharacterized protein LOC117138309 isoform X1 [Drosophila mauritiana]